MHGPPLDCEHRFAQALAERRMRMDGLDNFVGGQFAAHGYGEFADQIGGVRSNDMRAQNLAVFADDDLGETLGLANSDSFADRSPGKALYFGLGILLSGLSLR